MYEAIGRDGKQSSGMIKATSLEDVILQLMKVGKIPHRVEELNRSSFIAFSRLENLKAIKNKLDPTEPQPTSKSEFIPPREKSRLPVAWIIFILAWIAVIIAYAALK